MQESKKILIVEDSGPIRESLSELLQLRGFNVLTAENGLKAIGVLNSFTPDLILSDIMMPVMDGYQLLEKLRSSKETELIPLIFVTAKVNFNDKIKGLELGADDYIVKPFEYRELELKIQNLLGSRERLIKSITTISKSDITIKSQGFLFVKQLEFFMNSKLKDANLQISDLSGLMGMSDSTLHRKVKKYLNITPNQFINEFRLNKAQAMLQLNYASIADVAEKTGFASNAYFSTSYKNHFGYSPKNEKQVF
jgi:DNA-binding response OmpR family regulator